MLLCLFSLLDIDGVSVFFHSLCSLSLVFYLVVRSQLVFIGEFEQQLNACGKREKARTFSCTRQMMQLDNYMNFDEKCVQK